MVIVRYAETERTRKKTEMEIEMSQYCVLTFGKKIRLGLIEDNHGLRANFTNNIYFHEDTFGNLCK